MSVNFIIIPGIGGRGQGLSADQTQENHRKHSYTLTLTSLVNPIGMGPSKTGNEWFRKWPVPASSVQQPLLCLREVL